MTVRLPSVAVPHPDEALDGYLDRTSNLLRAPLAAILRAVDLDQADLGGFSTICLTKDRAAQIDHAFRLLPGTAERMTVAGGYNHVLPWLARARSPMDVVRAAATDWFFIAGSRFCPKCIAASGVWQLRWRLPWVVACRQHALLLCDECPECRAFPRSTGYPHQSHHTRWDMEIRNAGNCYAGLRIKDPLLGRASIPCRADLTRAPVQPAPPEVLDFQRRIDAALRGGTADIAGLALPSRSALSALRELLCLHRQITGDARARARVWRTPPRSVTAGAGQIIDLAPVWGASTADQAAAALLSLAAAHRKILDSNFIRDALGARRTLGQVYDAALRESGRFSTRLRRAATTGQGALPLYDYAPARVPQLAWPCCLPNELATHAGRPSRPMILAVMSLALVRLVVGTWDAAATALEFPATSGSQWSRYVVGHLSTAERAALYRAVFETAQRLSASSVTEDFTPGRISITTARHLPQAQQGHCPRACTGADTCGFAPARRIGHQPSDACSVTRRLTD